MVKDGSGNLTLQATSGGWCAAQSDDLEDGAGYTQYVSAMFMRAWLHYVLLMPSAPGLAMPEIVHGIRRDKQLNL